MLPNGLDALPRSCEPSVVIGIKSPVKLICGLPTELVAIIAELLLLRMLVTLLVVVNTRLSIASPTAGASVNVNVVPDTL